MGTLTLAVYYLHLVGWYFLTAIGAAARFVGAGGKVRGPLLFGYLGPTPIHTVLFYVLAF